MRASQVLFLALAVSSSLAAQPRGGGNGTYSSFGGVGNILHPGGGYPTTGGGNINFPTRLGNTVQGRPYSGYRPAQVLSPGASRTVVVPYAYPVVVNGTPQDEYLAQQLQQQQIPAPGQQAPTVIINQTFVPETLRPMVREYPDVPMMTTGPQGGMRGYEAPSGDASLQRLDAGPSAAAIADANRPTVYQIAFKSGATYSTVAYWVEGDTLNYVTTQGTLNRASMDLIDRDLSEQLNRERNVEFHLPH